jgi:hypothetical protein
MLAGCSSLAPLPPVNLHESGWTVREGQGVWKANADAPGIATDLLMAVNADGRQFVQLTKTPFPLMIAQRTRGGWQIELPTQGKRYSGHGIPPNRMLLLQLPSILYGSNVPSGWLWTPLPEERWRLENAHTGESLEGYFNQ